MLNKHQIDFIMKKIVLSMLFFGVALYATAQQEENIIVGKKLSVYSTTLKENRKIWVYTPGNSFTTLDSNKRYPVLYLLDGDAHFLSTVGIIQQLSQTNGNAVLPEMIVVGIENTNRLRDLTPNLITQNSNEASNPFLFFLSNELMPLIDKNYKTAPYKLIAGHSLGGLTVIDILTTNPALFNAYIAIDPSMWYNDEKFLLNTLTRLPKQTLTNKRLFVGIANTLPDGMNIAKVKSDKSPESQHIRSILKLDSFLKPNKIIGLKYASKYYDNDNHNSVPLISEYDGLRFIFDYFSMKASLKDFEDSTAVFANKLKLHYTNISKEIGYTIAPDQAVINYFAYDAIAKKQYKKAEAFLKLNIENFPNSYKAYDAYADYSMVIKDTVSATLNYQKALSLMEDISIRNKLNAINNRTIFSISENELKKYVGEYVLETYNIPVVMELRNSKLYAILQGGAESELVPISKNVFTVKGKQGYTITFEVNGDKALSFTSVQPDGIFKAVITNK